MNKNSKKDFLCVALVAGIICLGFIRLFLSEYSIRWDLKSVHYAALSFISDSWRETGALPLWNPSQYAGYPIIADPQAAIFYPINFIFLYFHAISVASIKFIVFVEYIIAGIGMYIFARYRAFSRYVACIASIVWPFSGFMVGHATHLGIISSYAWMPILLYCIDKALSKSRLRFAAIGSIIGAIIILAGHAQSALIIFTFALLYGVFLIIAEYRVSKNKKRIIRKSIILCALFLFSLGISAVQLLPTREFAMNSIRENVSIEKSQSESLDPTSLMTLVIPNFFDPVMYRDYWGPWTSTQHYLYIGIIPFILICMHAWRKRKCGHEYFYIFFGALFLLYALGKMTFVHSIMYLFVPLFDKFRAPANAMGIPLFCGIMLFCHALHKYTSLIEGEKKIILIKVKKIFLPIIIIAACAAFNVILYMDYTKKAQWKYINIISGIFYAEMIMVVAYILIRDYLQQKISDRKFMVILVIIIAVDLLTFTVNNQMVTFSEPLSKLERMNTVQAFLVQNEKTNTTKYRIYSEDAGRILPVSRISQISGYNPLVLRDFKEFFDLSFQSEMLFRRVMRTLNVRFLILEENFKEYAKNWTERDRGIKENIETTQYAWFVSEVRSLMSENTEQIQENIQKEEFGKVAWVQKNAGFPGVKTYAHPNYSTQILKHTPNVVGLGIQTDQDGFMVISELFYPGWKAYLDNHSIEVYKVDNLLRGFEIPKGEHILTMKFNPQSYAYGKILSISSLAFCFILFAFEFIVNRKKKNNIH